MDFLHAPFVGIEPATSFLRRLSWISLLSMLTSGCVLGRPSKVQIQAGRTVPAGASVSASPPFLKVATFNIWGLPSWINGADPNRYGRIARELDRLGSDVVLLQEVWTRRPFEVLSEKDKGSARTWWVASARWKGGFLGQNGLLTLSKYPIEAGEIRHFSTASMPDSLMHKGALKITVTIRSGLRVNIWNTHLQDGGSKRVRSRQIAELIRWVRDATDNQCADIVGGDFNSTPDSEEFRQLTAAIGPSVHQLANQAELPTWDGLKPASGEGESLDHIFVRMTRPSFEVRPWSRRVFTASRLEDRLSDHMGIESLLTFAPAEESGSVPLALPRISSLLPGVSALLNR